MGTRVAVFCVMVSATAGCHVVTTTAVPNLDVPRASPEPLEIAVTQAETKQPDQRFVAISAVHSDQLVALSRARVRSVQGSHCQVSSVPLCNGWGECQVGVTMAGEVCVLMVQVVSEYGHVLDPYCHDLSSEELNGEGASERRAQYALDRCQDEVARVRDADRFWW